MLKDIISIVEKKKEVDLKTASSEEARKAWTNDLVYNEDNVFKFYLKFLDWFENHTKELEDTEWTEPMEDDDGDMYDELITREKQESYLGYIPSDDQFVTGFDMWEGEDNPAGIVYWRYIKGKFAIIEESLDYSSVMMYGRRGGYKKLQNKHKDLVDIRLD